MGNRPGKKPRAEAFDEVLRSPWTMGKADIETAAARSRPARNLLFERQSRDAERHGNVVGRANRQDGQWNRAPSHASDDFPDRAVTARHNDDIGRLGESIGPMLRLGGPISDVMPAGLQ